MGAELVEEELARSSIDPLPCAPIWVLDDVCEYKSLLVCAGHMCCTDVQPFSTGCFKFILFSGQYRPGL